MNGEAAERIALQAFEWLSKDDELVMSFLGQSGADMSDLAGMAASADFLASVLDFVLGTDELVCGFAETAGFPAENVAIARQVLPGAEVVHWT